MHTHHLELTDDRINQLPDTFAHELRNMMQAHGRTLEIECEISGAYEKQTRHHPGATPDVEPVAVHLGDHTFDSTAILDDLIDYASLEESVLEGVEESQRAARAEHKASMRRDREWGL